MLQEIPPRAETCLQVSALSDIVNPDRQTTEPKTDTQITKSTATLPKDLETLDKGYPPNI